jgi:ADP-ribose pyrophosphatase YjhB (NUDIX family)
MHRLYPSHPLIGVGCVVCRENRVLLVRRAKPPRAGQWSLPGGLQELGETVYEAATREVFEETGVAIRVLGIADVVDMIEREPDGERVRYHYTLIDFYAGWLEGDPCPAGDVAEAAWIERDRLSALKMWSETERVIAKAFEQWRLAGSP